MKTISLDDIGLGGPFVQICVVVADLHSAMRAWSNILGIDSWAGWTYDSAFLSWRTYMGKPGEWSQQLAVTTDRDPQIELLQPLGGPSIFSEFFATNGPGIQHLSYRVPSLEKARTYLEAQGHPMVQAGGGHGVDGDGAFGYFDLRGTLGFVLEVIEPPRRRPAPHFVYKSSDPSPSHLSHGRPPVGRP